MFRPQSAAGSRPRSRGLHPMGALGVPPPVLILLDRPAGVECKKRGKERTIAPSRKKNSDHSRLPAVDHGLGDYTQWVHLVCPYRFRSHLPRPSGRAQIPKTTKHPVGVQIRRKQQEIIWKRMFQIAYPDRTRSVESLRTWTLARRAALAS